MDLLNQAQRWENEEEEEYTLVTLDISNMYMNISEVLGIKAVRYFLTEYPHLLHSRFSLEFVEEAILLVLRNNISFFDGRYKRQIHGCAMGSHKSPPYASLSVGYVEKVAKDIFQETKGTEYSAYIQHMLKRFLDDVFLKWKSSLGDIQEFFDVLNNVDEKINFTIESGKKIPFLDVCFELKGNVMETDIYYKPTDTHNYVQFGSFHPRKTLTNIPYSLARRICVIVSNLDTRDVRLDELRHFLLRKKYPASVIDSGIQRAKSLDRLEILSNAGTSNVDEDVQNIPFVHTNNCANPYVLSLVRDGLSVLLPSERMGRVMDKKKIVAARRQPHNLKSILFRPRFDTTAVGTKGSVTPCKKDPHRARRGRPCKCCDALQEVSTITFKGSDHVFELRYHFTCDTRNVIYAVTCNGCGDNYIGKTEREVRERCGDYCNAIERKNFTQVSP